MTDENDWTPRPKRYVLVIGRYNVSTAEWYGSSILALSEAKEHNLKVRARYDIPSDEDIPEHLSAVVYRLNERIPSPGSVPTGTPRFIVITQDDYSVANYFYLHSSALDLRDYYLRENPALTEDDVKVYYLERFSV